MDSHNFQAGRRKRDLPRPEACLLNTENMRQGSQEYSGHFACAAADSRRRLMLCCPSPPPSIEKKFLSVRGSPVWISTNSNAHSHTLSRCETVSRLAGLSICGRFFLQLQILQRSKVQLESWQRSLAVFEWKCYFERMVFVLPHSDMNIHNSSYKLSSHNLIVFKHVLTITPIISA